jgi:hypothetical protein
MPKSEAVTQVAMDVRLFAFDAFFAVSLFLRA